MTRLLRRSVLYARLVSLPIALSFGQEFAARPSVLTVVSVVLAAQFLTLTPSGAAIHVGSAMCPVISALGHTMLKYAALFFALTQYGYAEEKIATDFVWKRLTGKNDENKLVHVEFCYRSPSVGFARPKMFIVENGTEIFNVELIESKWLRDNLYTAEFNIIFKSIRNVHVMIESNGKDAFMEKEIVEIPDKDSTEFK